MDNLAGLVWVFVILLFIYKFYSRFTSKTSKTSQSLSAKGNYNYINEHGGKLFAYSVLAISPSDRTVLLKSYESKGDAKVYPYDDIRDWSMEWTEKNAQRTDFMLKINLRDTQQPFVRVRFWTERDAAAASEHLSQALNAPAEPIAQPAITER